MERLLRFGLIQAKLKVSEPGDSYEQEADRISGHVLATPARSGVGGAGQIRRDAGQSRGETATAPSSVQHALASPSKPLEPALRRDMEQNFGWDFSTVRVHLGAIAEQSARDVNARAYTVGSNMVFGAGEFNPGTREGRRLLAHELTHVVQQSGTDANVVRRSNGFDDDEPTLVERRNPKQPPWRGHVERVGEKLPETSLQEKSTRVNRAGRPRVEVGADHRVEAGARHRSLQGRPASPEAQLRARRDRSPSWVRLGQSMRHFYTCNSTPPISRHSSR